MADGKIIVAIMGARMHYTVPKTLLMSGRNVELYTDFYAFKQLRLLINGFSKWYNSKTLKRMALRFDVSCDSKVKSFWYVLIFYHLLLRLERIIFGSNGSNIHAVFNKLFSSGVAKNVYGGCIFYGCNGASLEAAKAVKKHGGKVLLEQTILPRIFENYILHTGDVSLKNYKKCSSWRDKLAERERHEWEIADYVLAPSDFVADCLRRLDVPSEKIHKLPYGIDLSRFEYRKFVEPELPLKILFVGEVGYRKGADLLIKAAKLLYNKSLQVDFLGRMALLNSHGADSDDSRLVFHGSVPRDAVKDYINNADLFVLPSRVEGLPISVLEALASGLPIIISKNVGCDISNGMHGFILEEFSELALASLINRFFDVDFLTSCNKNIFAFRNSISVDNYKRNLNAIIDKLSDS